MKLTSQSLSFITTGGDVITTVKFMFGNTNKTCEKVLIPISKINQFSDSVLMATNMRSSVCGVDVGEVSTAQVSVKGINGK